MISISQELSFGSAEFVSVAGEVSGAAFSTRVEITTAEPIIKAIIKMISIAPKIKENRNISFILKGSFF
jgi:hypothetical protein